MRTVDAISLALLLDHCASNDPPLASSADEGVATPTVPAPGTANAGTPTDLSAHGLPIVIALAACADGTAPKIEGPAVKIADNAADKIISCPQSEKDAMDGKPVFAIQIGLAEGKIGAKEVAADLNFVRFVSDDPRNLEWESNVFNQPKREFLLRVAAGGTDYACFPQFGASDDALYQAELAACRSIQAK